MCGVGGPVLFVRNIWRPLSIEQRTFSLEHIILYKFHSDPYTPLGESPARQFTTPLLAKQITMATLHLREQCSGSVGYVCFYSSRSTSGSVIYLYRSGSIHQQEKMTKNLDFYYFVTSLWLFIFEEWCKCTFKKDKHRELDKKIIFCWHLEGPWWKEQDTESDPVVKGTDSRIQIRIRTKISRIRNTDCEIPLFSVQAYFFLKLSFTMHDTWINYCWRIAGGGGGGGKI